MSKGWHSIVGFDGYEVSRNGVVRYIDHSRPKSRRVRVLEVDKSGFYALRRCGQVHRYSMDDIWALAGIFRASGGVSK